MIKAFIFIVAIVTNEGELQMRGIEVEACPEKESFQANMDEMQKQGKLKEWNAICYELPKQGQDL